MERVHQPWSNMVPVQQVPHAVGVPYQVNQESLSRSRPDGQLRSMRFGFTLTEVAHASIQVAGVIIAGVFGAWAVKSYESANVANRLAQEALQQSLNANVLAIINLCLSDQFRDFIDCSAMLQEAPFASIMHGVIPNLSIISSSSTEIRSTSTPPATLSPPRPSSISPVPSPLPPVTRTGSAPAPPPDPPGPPGPPVATPPLVPPPPPVPTPPSTPTPLADTTTPPVPTPPSTPTPLPGTTPPPVTTPSPATPPPVTTPSPAASPPPVVSPPSLSQVPTPPPSNGPVPTTSITSRLTSPTRPAPTVVTSSPLTAGMQLPFGTIVAIIVAVVIAVAIVCLLLIRYRRARRSRF